MNIASSEGGEDSVSRDIRLGIGYDKDKYLLSMDVQYVMDDQNVNLALGGEVYLLNDKFRIGAGVELQGISQGVKPSVGFGYDIGKLVIDYAFAYSINLPDGAIAVTLYPFCANKYAEKPRPQQTSSIFTEGFGNSETKRSHIFC